MLDSAPYEELLNSQICIIVLPTFWNRIYQISPDMCPAAAFDVRNHVIPLVTIAFQISFKSVYVIFFQWKKHQTPAEVHLHMMSYVPLLTQQSDYIILHSLHIFVHSKFQNICSELLQCCYSHSPAFSSPYNVS